MTKEEALKDLFDYIKAKEQTSQDSRLVKKFKYYPYKKSPNKWKSYCELVSGDFNIVLNLLSGTKKKTPIIQIHLWGDVKSIDGVYQRLQVAGFAPPQIDGVVCAWYDGSRPPKKNYAHVIDLEYSTDWTNLNDTIRAKVYDMYRKIVESLNDVGAFAWKQKKRTATNIADFVDKDHLVTESVAKLELDEYARALSEMGQIVLTGAPGTGKTFLARALAAAITGDDLDGDGELKHIEMCQFHPSFDYSDFVEGLRPIKDDDGKFGFERRDGVFMDFCRKAIESPDERFVFIIDEINRGDISKIFGELFFAIEKSYRGKKGLKTRYNNLMEPNHPFKKGGFFVPKNVYIIGTMNDIDRGVESMDFAIRRRFRWIEIKSADRFDEIMRGVERMKKKQACHAMAELNTMISSMEGLGPAYAIGPSYFSRIAQPDMTWSVLWTQAIEPLLREYMRGFGDGDEKIKDLRNCYTEATKQSDDDEEDDETEPNGEDLLEEAADHLIEHVAQIAVDGAQASVVAAQVDADVSQK